MSMICETSSRCIDKFFDKARLESSFCKSKMHVTCVKQKKKYNSPWQGKKTSSEYEAKPIKASCVNNHQTEEIMITSARNFCCLGKPSSSWYVCAEQREGDFMDIYVFMAKQKGKRRSKQFPASQSYIGKRLLFIKTTTTKKPVFT